MFNLFFPSLKNKVALILLVLVALLAANVLGILSGLVQTVLICALVLVIALWLLPLVRSIWRWFWQTDFGQRYSKDLAYRGKVNIGLSTLVNLFNLVVSVYMYWTQGAIWYLTMAIYFALLVVIMIVLGRQVKNQGRPLKVSRSYQLTGILLLVVSAVIIWSNSQLVSHSQVPTYPVLILFFLVAYTLFNTAMGLFNIFQYRKIKGPLVQAAALTDLTAVLVALFSLQVSTLEFLKSDAAYQTRFNAQMGLGLFVIIVLVGLYLIIRGQFLAKKA